MQMHFKFLFVFDDYTQPTFIVFSKAKRSYTHTLYNNAYPNSKNY